ncbi:hypothetical protein GTNG_1213 [Geobacillus thermodenitrificans NG80-2]|uniref:Uncharacterized protein n=1 Tax=Geobacillus thermodenitrificans (strain NG80-2) TaxID=420246 RepID=A4IMN1_GEOTN|nr:hypothetical protein GTNG_1213 [Geobacillus thermodenitrificans NG80-2]
MSFQYTKNSRRPFQPKPKNKQTIACTAKVCLGMKQTNAFFVTAYTRDYRIRLLLSISYSYTFSFSIM